MPAITACICTHNRPDYLCDSLDGLTQQTVGPVGFRILVVDSGSPSVEATQIRALVEDMGNANLLSVDRPGLSVARNAARRVIADGYIAYLDDDAIPAPDWIGTIGQAVSSKVRLPVLLGGAMHPLSEAPLPHWWPARLRAMLSITEMSGQGGYCRPGMAETMEPVGANVIVNAAALHAANVFSEAIGRTGRNLLSEEKKIFAWGLQDRGETILYDSRILVYHQIQAERLLLRWLLARLYWQGLSRVRGGRILGEHASLRREAVRCAVVCWLFATFALLPARVAWLIGPRSRLAHADGFLHAYVSCGTAR
ncbi:MAG: glycosyltransferase family 2 protein [Acetobacteraceae bacterium]|nr:glycosyltransferase family 2 protein [Acetobacteraceae bacterium]MSP30631.1 glycosyltransferase family 2 protein [Acetobacteraceae bacterium]